MALIHGDEVEEVPRELLVKVVHLPGAGHGLVEAEIDLEGLVHSVVCDLRQSGAGDHDEQEAVLPA
jgi:hypothetical protein